MHLLPGSIRRRFTNAASLLACVAALGGCALPPLEGRTQSAVLAPEPSRDTAIGRALAPELAGHPGLSGIYPVEDARDAFAVRMRAAQLAQRSLDVQYYIWRDDLTGTLLLEALHEAADRGVRVRLLLDDHGVAGLDEVLAALDAHPNVEVRLFNPFVVRSPKFIGFVTDFSRLNRRMHNKSFTADAQATVVGGRNVGDEYFGATDGVLFADLDVLAVGPIAADTESEFDLYWNSDSAYPADLILPAVGVARLDELAREASRVGRDPAAAAYMKALADLPVLGKMIEGTLPFEWATTHMVSDDPAKALGTAPKEGLIGHQMREIIGVPTREVDLISPYFVPGAGGTREFANLAQGGVAVRVLTNALEATDVAAVHSGYARRRQALLEAGVELYELRRLSGIEVKDKGRAGSGGSSGGSSGRSSGQFGSSGSSLHAKTFAIDAQHVFVGSFNFDPRSANLNTELGFIIDSPRLAGKIENAFATTVPLNAYQVKLDEDGKLVWLERRGGEVIRHDTEPNTTWYGRFGIWFMSILPIEWML